MKKTWNNPTLKDSLNRITTAIRPHKDIIRDFVINNTYLNGRKFSTKNHEYQDVILEELTDPDIQFVIHKVAQAGASELIYRVLMAYAATVPGYYAALILPSLAQTSEVIKIRINSIIQESPILSKLRDPNVDSASLKRLKNGSIIYGLSGSGTSKSTVITRPIRTIVVDELARVDMGTVTAMSARQRHQEHKSSIYFSTPLFEGFDIDAELDLCGHLLETILKCTRCGYEFFPSYYDHVRIPGYTDPLTNLTISKVSKLDLDIDEAYLECPKCNRKTEFGYPHTKWVNVAEKPNLPKRGIKIGPFDLPHYVSVPDLVRGMIMTDDRNEFDQQFLAIPTPASKSALDVSQVRFERQEPGPINVIGLDIGKFSCLTVGSITEHGALYIHHVEFIPLKDLRTRVHAIVKEYRAAAMVVDYLPYTEVSAFFVNTIPNCWASIYKNTTTVATEMFTLKSKDDEAVGNIKQITINMTPAFDFFADQVVSGLVTYKSSSMDNEILKQLSVMRKVRDYRSPDVPVYKWVKPRKMSGGRDGKAEDHIHHSSVMCLMAQRLLSKNKYAGGIPVSSLLSTFKLKVDI